MKYDILNGFKSYIDLKLNTNTSKTYYSAVSIPIEKCTLSANSKHPIPEK